MYGIGAISDPGEPRTRCARVRAIDVQTERMAELLQHRRAIG
jgi:hypothetical protein